MKKAKLTPAEMRVAIAKDVIKQIKAKRMRIISGAYVRQVFGQSEFIDQETCTSKRFQCNVCAIGAGIVSGVRLFNEVQEHTGTMGIETAQRLIRKWFTLRQAILMESALEYESSRALLHSYRYNAKFKKGELNKADEMYYDLFDRYPHMEDRVIAIYRNVIKNKGDFKP
jgi:hypothetical protein